MKSVVVGSGAWGTALAIRLCKNGHDVTMWTFEKELIPQMENERLNIRLPGAKLPAELKISGDIYSRIDPISCHLDSLTSHNESILVRYNLTEGFLFLASRGNIKTECIRIEAGKLYYSYPFTILHERIHFIEGFTLTADHFTEERIQPYIKHIIFEALRKTFESLHGVNKSILPHNDSMDFEGMSHFFKKFWKAIVDNIANKRDKRRCAIIDNNIRIFVRVHNDTDNFIELYRIDITIFQHIKSNSVKTLKSRKSMINRIGINNDYLLLFIVFIKEILSQITCGSAFAGTAFTLQEKMNSCHTNSF